MRSWTHVHGQAERPADERSRVVDSRDPFRVIAALQQSAGNAAVSRLLAASGGSSTARIQRAVADERGSPMSHAAIVERIERDPSAVLRPQAVPLLRRMEQETTVYTIGEILEALGAGPALVQRGRGEGDLKLHSPLPVTELPLSQIAGTHASVAKTFDDPQFTVEKTAQQLIGNPNLVRSDRTFELTVFRATKPHDPNGAPLVWSMNNRRVKAMQIADRELQGALPAVRVKWATKDDMNYAVGPGKFANVAHGEVGFHSAPTRALRLHALTQSAAPERGNVEAIADAMDDPDALAQLLNL